MIRVFTTIAILAFIITGCQTEHVIFNEKLEVPAGVWSYDDRYEFSFIVDDIAPIYRLSVEITHAEDFQWENFYTRIYTEFPQDTVKEDIVSLELASKLGSWYGKCRSGSCTITIPLQNVVRFKQTGSHKISFEQFMREERLQGIEAIRLRLIEMSKS